MGNFQRLKNILVALALIACGITVLLLPDHPLVFIAIFLGAGLAIYGLRMVWYFVTMARHMAGGLAILFIGIIALDAGVFMLALSDGARLPIVLYLAALNAFSGIVSILRAVEGLRLETHWKARLVSGVVSLLLAVACVQQRNSDQAIVIIFCLGLFYSAITRIYDALRPTEIIHIP